VSGDLYLGIMSGTSLDGVDAALCRFGPEHKLVLVSEASVEWPSAMRSILYDLATAETVPMDTLARAHFLLPYYYRDAASAAIRSAGASQKDVRAIGVHGQTVRHLPVPEALFPDAPAVSATLQLGSGPALAALTGIDVVSDFRSADVALHGQGAPLVPMFDNAFLRSQSIDRVAVNIGGIANITWLPTNASQNVIAFDTGPGNMIIDSLARTFFDRPFDASGEIARRGNVDEALLDELLGHRYFSEPPPKSTGRELFGHEFLERFIDEVKSNRLTSEDAVATATELTAKSIANAVNSLTRTPCELLVSGGGAKNDALLARIQYHLSNSVVKTTDTIGIPVQSKEAIAFAFFAYAFIKDLQIHLPSTTGASRPTLLGSLSRGK
jgi:anhydro-N-acetylmuramic acid kinase